MEHLLYTILYAPDQEMKHSFDQTKPDFLGLSKHYVGRKKDTAQYYFTAVGEFSAGRLGKRDIQG